VVTIYILIPFLVIPQIILSGIIVKYEKLNPQISSPSRIPFYGEVITARWAYEGLATYQYINNDYETNFYYWDKVQSNAGFKSNFLIKDLQNKLAEVKQDYMDPDKAESVAYNLRVIRNEIEDEFLERLIFKEYYPEAPDYSMGEHLDQLYPESLDDDIIAYTEKYLSALRAFYTDTYKAAYEGKNGITNDFNLDKLQELKRKHYNETLEEFVTNKNVFERITEYNGQLIQKIDPIFHDPVHRFIKAHFYAPRKMIFGVFLPTIWVNVIVIWIMTIVFYVLLYFRALKRLLDFFESIGRRKKYRQ
jgi:hypothetical protein